VFARQLADYVSAIGLGGAPRVRGDEGRGAVALAEACYRLKQPLRMPWDYPEAYAAIGRNNP
jgi:hypothetical protein